jgi:2-polyprenyl-6-methoxyphenol hydroxylase-like FAD-dependent oxidoreductase
MDTSLNTTTAHDAIVIGGGIAGATAAAVMAKRGVRVLMIDQRNECPACFKAEKIEPHQAVLLRKFGLMDAVLPFTGRIHEILDARNGRVFKVIPIEQYGIFYHDLVNAIRRQAAGTCDFKQGRVTGITLDRDVQTVTFADGASYSARLIVDACGTSTSLLGGLGLERDVVEREQSVAFGFTLARADGSEFPFDSVTYYPSVGATKIGYLTLFRIGAAMRANLFVFWPPRDERTRRLQQHMEGELSSLFPRLFEVTGPMKVVSKVEVGLIDLYRTLNPVRDGLVLIGDAFQSVCPTTATGLSKSLTDVDVLCYECLPQWLATPGMGADKIRMFYDNPRKQEVDQHSFGGGMYQRAMAVQTSLGWTARRWRKLLRMQSAAWKFRLSPRKTTGAHG